MEYFIVALHFNCFANPGRIHHYEDSLLGRSMQCVAYVNLKSLEESAVPSTGH